VLDTFPYNGHTTSLDSLWMGVPVITLVGQTTVGRAGLSQLTNLGLPELIGGTPEDFVRIAVDLAGDLPRLGDLRTTLRGRMEASPPDGRRTLCPRHRGRLPRHVATLVREPPVVARAGVIRSVHLSLSLSLVDGQDAHDSVMLWYVETHLTKS
jgi:hypothetical protein